MVVAQSAERLLLTSEDPSSIPDIGNFDTQHLLTVKCLNDEINKKRPGKIHLASRSLALSCT